MTSDSKHTAWILALIPLAALLAYLPALQAGFIWDDDAYVENNHNLRDLAGLVRIWLEPRSSPQYYPLVHTTFWLEFRLWGLEPLGYHLVNLLLHLGSTGLLFLLVRRLALPGAWIAASLFALHPVMVESVAWVTERKNVLSMVFYLGAMLQCVRGLGIDSGPPPKGTGWWWRAVALFCCALASKSVTFSLPFAVLVLSWWRRGRLGGREVMRMAPLMGIGIAYGAFTSHLEATHVMAAGPEWDQSLGERFLIAGRVPWFYLSKLLWPDPLTFIYPRWDVTAAATWQFLFPLATVLLVGWLAARARRHGERGPLAVVLLFGGTLFPALGFIDVYPFRYAFVADHFQYHAAAAIFCGVAAFTAARLPAAWGRPVVLIVLGLCAGRTFLQAQKYESREVLYQSILADDPDNWFAHNNLAALRVQSGDFEAAFAGYRRAHELHPILEPKATSDAYAHAQIGAMIGKTWSLQPALRAMQDYQRFVMAGYQRQPTGAALESFKAEAQARWARLRETRDQVLPQLLEAVRRFELSLAASPDVAETSINYGVLCQGLGNVALEEADDGPGRLRKAVELWTHALQLQPENGVLRRRLVRLHESLAERAASAGNAAEAEAHRATVRRLDVQPLTGAKNR